jgi:hypothetical protein
MKLNQVCLINPKIQSLLNTLEGQRTAFDLIPVKPELSLSLRRHSSWGVRFSASIEGIAGGIGSYKPAIQNLVKNYIWLYHQHDSVEINLDFIKLIHSSSHHNLGGDAGQFRTEQSAIFNSAGVPVYITPPPQEIRPLLTTWHKQIMKSKQHSVVQAIISHYQFEKFILSSTAMVG